MGVDKIKKEGYNKKSKRATIKVALFLFGNLLIAL